MTSNYDVVIRNGLVWPGSQLLDIGITGDRIRTVAPAIKESGNLEFDANGRVAISGFFDCHMHLDKALLGEERSNRSGTLEEGIKIFAEIKPQLSEQGIEDRASRAARMALANGTLAIRTHVDVDPDIELRGVRALVNVRREMAGLLPIQIVAFPQEGLTNIPGSVHLLREALHLGADLVGGIPAIDPNPKQHIDTIFEIAEEFGVDIDMHVDETDDPSILTLEYLAEKTIKEGYEGRVSAGHCCSLAAVDNSTAMRVMRKVAEASINIVTLPSSNLYLQGRHDSHPIRRGLTRVKDLARLDVNTCCASDNIRDPFNPFGNADLLQIMLLLAHAAHMGSHEELALAFAMGTRNAAKMMRMEHLVQEGTVANLVVLDAESPQDAIVSQADRMLVVSQGSMILQNDQFGL